MLKGKNLLWVALGAGVAYWYWNKMKKEKAAKAALATTPGSATNFTGDLSVPAYENAAGEAINLSDRQWMRLHRIGQNNPARAQRVANRMVGRSM